MDWRTNYLATSTGSIIRVIALSIILVSAMTLLGYTVEIVDLVGWRMSPGMAINTAVSFILIGFCLLLLTKRAAQP